MQDTDKPTQAQEVKPAAMPETMVINGVTYRREGDEVDQLVNIIGKYKAVAARADVTLRQAVWFNEGDRATPLPD